MLTPIALPDLTAYPDELHSLLRGVKLYDSSCSPEARVVFIDKDGGYFLKSAPKGALEREAAMTRYFHGKGLAASVLLYRSTERDWLLTEKVPGDDCTADRYLAAPQRLADTLAERLSILHAADFSGCPIPNHTERYLARAEEGRCAGKFAAALFPKPWAPSSADEAWAMVEKDRHRLRADTLLHGDYCLPNLILNDWSFSGFIDLDSSGVGDRHVDLFWATWTLNFNLKTDRYRQRFLDAYGRGKVEEEMLRLIAAIEVFG